MPLVQGLSERQQSFFNQVHLVQFAFVTYIIKKGHGPKTYMTNQSGITASHPGYARQASEFGWWVLPEGAGGEFYGADYKGRAMAGSFLREEKMAAWRESGRSLPDYCLPLIQESYPCASTRFCVNTAGHVSLPPRVSARLCGFSNFQAQRSPGLHPLPSC